jgi:protoporphyrinogen oxidase
MSYYPVVIIGAGPAGLTAAYELVKSNVRPFVLEKGDKVGGLARTEIYKGYRFDIGGHRFYTKENEVQQLWERMLGKDFRRVPRLSRIYYQKRLFNYPLDLFNTLSNLGWEESFRILLSYLKWQLRPYRQEPTFEHWVINRFGGRLYKTFFKTYTEKVWGIPCDCIQAEWAAQRIKGLSLRTAICNALFRTNNVKTLISEFHYPVLGPGMMWERFQKFVQNGGGKVQLNSHVIKVARIGNRIKTIVIRHQGRTDEIFGKQFISTMPLTELIAALDPPAPDEVIHCAKQLNFRALILVGLIINRANVFPDNWIYVHTPNVQVGRIQNPKNWSADLVPDPHKTSLGLEYFSNEGDAIWNMSNAELIELATREIDELGLADVGEVEDGVVFRQPKAYPVYDMGYRKHLEVIQQFLSRIENLQTIGRNGMHRYNNQDHSMLMGMLVARNLQGEAHDLWSVNTERTYYEDHTRDPSRQNS